MGKIEKIYFGTPYKTLTNYKDIKEKHKDLQKYCFLKEELIQYCKNKDITYTNYEFEKLGSVNSEDFEKLWKHHCIEHHSKLCWYCQHCLHN